MVRVLSTKEILAEIIGIFDDAKEYVYLVSPYLDIVKDYKDRIREKNEEKIHVMIIYGKKKNQYKFDSQAKAELNSLNSVEIFYCKELHAKCYINESKAVITSMNLYEASENNFEMGILLSKEEDLDAYNKLKKDIGRIKVNSELVRTRKFKKTEKGYCIRCGEELELDISHPYCKLHYLAWKKYNNKNPSEAEDYCHICGKKRKTTFDYPACLKCYKSNIEMFKK